MLTPWVTIIILANVAVYAAHSWLPIGDAFWILVPELIPSRPWTLISYMFMHQGTAHIVFNMLSLVIFGPRVERQLSGGKFVGLYLVSGIGGGLLSWIFTPGAAIVGASGAVLGIMFAYARFWPRDTIFVFFLPMEARFAILAMVAIDLFGLGANIAHFAHLGGVAAAFLYMQLLDRTPRNALNARKTQFESKMRTPRVSRSDILRWSKIKRDELHSVNREEVERIMEKIEKQGVGSVTPQERVFLDNFSERYGG